MSMITFVKKISIQDSVEEILKIGLHEAINDQLLDGQVTDIFLEIIPIEFIQTRKEENGYIRIVYEYKPLFCLTTNLKIKGKKLDIQEKLSSKINIISEKVDGIKARSILDESNIKKIRIITFSCTVTAIKNGKAMNSSNCVCYKSAWGYAEENKVIERLIRSVGLSFRNHARDKKKLSGFYSK